MSRALAAAVLALLAISAAPVAALDTRVADRCRIVGYGRDTDPRGSTLRAGPSRGAPPVGTLPPVRRENSDLVVAADFDIVGGRDGWFLIQNVTHPTYLEGARDRSFPKLRGWLAAGLVDLQIGWPTLMDAPRAKAGAILSLSGSLPTGAWGADSVRVERVFRCSGGFVEVAILTPDGRRARGWAAGICNNQVSTCGGAGRFVEDRGGELVEVSE